MTDKQFFIKALLGCTLGSVVGNALGGWARKPLPPLEAACARRGGEWTPAFVRADGGVLHACVVDGEAVPLAPMGVP